MSNEDNVDPTLVELQLLSKLSSAIRTLTDFVGKLEDLENRTVEEGIIEPKDVSVGTEKIVVRPPFSEKLWFGVKITNDGPSSVLVWVNTRKSSKPHELRRGETWGVQFKTAVIEDVLLYTEGGTTTVRVRGER